MQSLAFLTRQRTSNAFYIPWSEHLVPSVQGSRFLLSLQDVFVRLETFVFFKFNLPQDIGLPFLGFNIFLNKFVAVHAFCDKSVAFVIYVVVEVLLTGALTPMTFILSSLMHLLFVL